MNNVIMQPGIISLQFCFLILKHDSKKKKMIATFAKYLF